MISTRYSGTQRVGSMSVPHDVVTSRTGYLLLGHAINTSMCALRRRPCLRCSQEQISGTTLGFKCVNMINGFGRLAVSKCRSQGGEVSLLRNIGGREAVMRHTDAERPGMGLKRVLRRDTSPPWLNQFQSLHSKICQLESRFNPPT
jgi:hypothetical protein